MPATMAITRLIKPYSSEFFLTLILIFNAYFTANAININRTHIDTGSDWKNWSVLLGNFHQQNSAALNFSLNNLSLSHGANGIVLPLLHTISISKDWLHTSTVDLLPSREAIRSSNAKGKYETNTSKLWWSINLQLEYFTPRNVHRKLRSLRAFLVRLRILAEKSNSVSFGSVPGVILNTTQASTPSSTTPDNNRQVLHKVIKEFPSLIQSFNMSSYPLKLGLVVDNVDLWCSKFARESNIFNGIDLLLLDYQRQLPQTTTVETLKTIYDKCRLHKGDPVFGIIFAVHHGQDRLNAEKTKQKIAQQEGNEGTYFCEALVLDNRIFGFESKMTPHLQLEKKETYSKADARKGRKGSFGFARTTAGSGDSEWAKWLVFFSILLGFLTCICRFTSSDDEE